MIINRVYEILKNISKSNDFVCKVRWAPDNKSLVVDINYNKALRVCVIRNEIHIQGDINLGNKLKELIEGALKDGN